MLSGFFLFEKEWMEASIAIGVLLVLIIVLIKRYKKRGKKMESGYCDCDCLPIEALPLFKKMDCDGGDCDVTPDCSP